MSAAASDKREQVGRFLHLTSPSGCKREKCSKWSEESSSPREGLTQLQHAKQNLGLRCGRVIFPRDRKDGP